MKRIIFGSFARWMRLGYRKNKLVSENFHWKPIMSHSDMFVNIGRTLVPFFTIRTRESWLTTTIVFHMCLEGLLIGVTSIATWTMISHLWPLKNWLNISLFFCSSTQIHVCPYDIHDVRLVCDTMTYEQQNFPDQFCTFLETKSEVTQRKSN